MEDSEVKADVHVGPALLVVTHGCELDKPRGKSPGAPPRIERLQFLPLLDLAQPNVSRQDVAGNASWRLPR